MINTFRSTLPPQGLATREYYDVRNENFDEDIPLQTGKLHQQVPYNVTNPKLQIGKEVGQITNYGVQPVSKRNKNVKKRRRRGLKKKYILHNK